MLPNRAALALAALLPLAAGCAKAPPPPELPALNRLESYAFDPASPLESRIRMIPPSVLEFFRALDGRNDYRGYEPSAADRALIMRYLRLLPPVYEKVFGARCVGIYFVPGMQGNGLTDWIAGPDGKIYFHLILNPAPLRKSLSETLTERDRSCYLPGNGWALRVEAGGKYTGLLYLLAHEGTHGLDYAAGVTPYTDDTMPEYYRPRRPVSGGFFLSRWRGYDVPRPEIDFRGRDKVTFYGFGGGPKLAMAAAPEIYGGMVKGGFVSLYASRSWAEELADAATFGALAALEQPYRIEVSGPAGRKEVFEPLQGAAAGQAAAALELLGKVKI